MYKLYIITCMYILHDNVYHNFYSFLFLINLLTYEIIIYNNKNDLLKNFIVLL